MIIWKKKLQKSKDLPKLEKSSIIQNNNKAINLIITALLRNWCRSGVLAKIKVEEFNNAYAESFIVKIAEHKTCKSGTGSANVVLSSSLQDLFSVYLHRYRSVVIKKNSRKLEDKYFS